MAIERPRYATSKRALWVSGGLAWGAIYAVLFGHWLGVPEALAGIVIPAMVMMIVALLGVHRAFGSLDMRTMAAGWAGRAPRPARTRVRLPRDDPEVER